MKTGDMITLGNYAGEPIVWKVIGEKDGRFLLLSRNVLEHRPFHPVDESTKYYGRGRRFENYYETNWETCELRQWMNGEFADAAFTAEELSHIPTVSVDYPSFYITLHSFFRDVNQVESRIFPLSEAEVRKYLSDEADRAALLTAHATQNPCSPRHAWGSWWLRTTDRMGYGAKCKYINNCVRDEKFLGTIIGTTAVWTTDVGIRPAMWYIP